MSLKLVNLRKSFFQGDQSIEVLRSVNAVVDTGEVVAIIGQSGSGKSTLLSLIAGLEKPDSGHIWIDQTDIARLNEQDVTSFRGANLSLVFQQYHLVAHLTALENVVLPMEILGKRDAEKQAKQLLEELGLGHRLGHFPSQLSGGESQRVAIARALITNPKVLLADEPSGNLDVETGEKMVDTFFRIVRQYKTTTVVVTHSELLAKKCSRALLLKNGILQEIRL